MTTSVINSNRFGKFSKKGRKVNRLFQYAVPEHSVRLVTKQREVNVGNAALNSRVVIEPSMTDFFCNAVLKVKTSQITGGGSLGANWAVDLIKSLEVRSGSNVISTYNPYRCVIQHSLDRCDIEKR